MNFKMIAKRSGKCAITGEKIIAGVTEIEKCGSGWKVSGVPTLRERQEAERQERIAKNLSEKVFANGWRIWFSGGNRHPSSHHELGCVGRTPDGRYGIIGPIFYTGERVQIGRALDFDIYEHEVFAQSEIEVVGLVAIPNNKGGYDTRSL